MSYKSIGNQLSMAIDKHRNEQYEIALKKIITADSVVLDLGAGLGPFGLLAAKLGAKKVYFIEPESVIHTIKTIARDNGLLNKVECLQGRIEDISLPEKVDVITSCFTGNFLLSEDLLPSLYYARDKHLKPGGVMIPDTGTMFAVPVTAPALHKKHVQRVSEKHLGLDFSHHRKALANTVIRNNSLTRKHYLAQACEVQTLDFKTEALAVCDQTLDFEINRSGLCHGFLGWFDMTLVDKTLSTGPDAPDVHWSRLWFPIDPPLEVNEGDALSIKIKKPAKKNWSWIVQANGEKRIHSAALEDLVNNNKRPTQSSQLSMNSAQLMMVLNGLHNGRSEKQIAQKLNQGWPKMFDLDSALILVNQWRDQHCESQPE